MENNLVQKHLTEIRIIVSREGVVFMKKTSLAGLTLGALGIVYGDIGTSPLYAMNEVFFGSGGMSISAEHIAGVASLIFWLLVVVIGVKYAGFVLHADHNGEGGSFALLSILEQFQGKRITALLFLLMFAGGLLVGEGIITPAISVLSAVEGMKVVNSYLEPFVVPFTVGILFFVFFFQNEGTRLLGRVYGPVMFVWFLSLAVLGISQIVQHPEIIGMVINPVHIWELFQSTSFSGILFLLGAAFLTLTGSEALYADLGHLGKRAIRVGWFFIVFPSLTLCYAGQAAYLLGGNSVSGNNLFYSIVPEVLLIPMIVLATAATIIASVALIFGAYSLMSQAIALGIFPRLKIVHTNREAEGQIYIPTLNWFLFLGSISLVFLFGSATNLAAAYGFAVSGVMAITSLAMFAVSKHRWGWRAWISGSVFGGFFLLDVVFVSANSIKFFEGGYIPFLFGCLVFTVIAVWRWGRECIRRAYQSYVADRNMEWFLGLKKKVESSGGIFRDERSRWVSEMDRAVVFLISRPITKISDAMPVKLRVYLKRRGVIPKNILLLHVRQERVPYMKKRQHIIYLGSQVYAMCASFGFMEKPDAPRILRELYKQHIFEEKFFRCTIEVSEDEFIVDRDVSWHIRFRAGFFRLLQRFSIPAYRYFGFVQRECSGVAKTVVPLRISRQGIRVEIPEFPFQRNNERIDPDTLEPSTVPFSRIA